MIVYVITNTSGIRNDQMRDIVEFLKCGVDVEITNADVTRHPWFSKKVVDVHD